LRDMGKTLILDLEMQVRSLLSWVGCPTESHIRSVYSLCVSCAWTNALIAALICSGSSGQTSTISARSEGSSKVLIPPGPVQEISAMETEGIGTFHNHSQEDYRGFLEGFL